MLYLIVKLRISPETRHMIYFQHPRLQFVVKHHIKSKKITAEIRLFCLTSSVKMRKLRLDDVHGLYYDLFYLAPDLTSILSIYLSIPLTHKLPLKHIFKPQFVFFTVEFFIVFIQGVVGQMSKCIVKILVMFVFLAR